MIAPSQGDAPPVAASPAPAPQTPAAVSTRAALEFLDAAFPPPRRFRIRLWDGTESPGVGKPAFTLVVGDAGALRRAFAPPLLLSAGEAFVRGDLDVEGDVEAAVAELDETIARAPSRPRAIAILRAYLRLPRSAHRVAPAQRGPASLPGPRRSRERDRAAVRFHYDVGNAFFQLFLDERLVYSCAYFRARSDPLGEAQERKLDHVCRKLRLEPGDRLLDLGCGYGALAIHAASRYRARVVGVTLSPSQVALARDRVREAGLEDRVRIELADDRDVGEGGFDKVAGTGTFEHVGRERLSGYFARIHRLLGPGGLFLNESISRRAEPDAGAGPAARVRSLAGDAARRLVGRGVFLDRHVFPDSDPVPVGEANLAAERAGFEVRDVEGLREHYALTLREWVRRLEARREEAIAAAGAEAYRTWRLYMAASARAFETGAFSVHQTLLSRPEAGRSGLPLTRDDLHRAA